MINLNQNEPSPIKKKVCECGCEIEFQPRRTNQIYLNKKHADYSNNHGKRKLMNKKAKEIEAQLRKNDQILDKFFKLQQETPMQFPLKALETEGFKSNLTIRHDPNFFHTYNYAYKLIKNNQTILVLITKL